MFEKDLHCKIMIQILMMKRAISVMNEYRFVQIEFRSNDQSKWLTELIDRSL